MRRHTTLGSRILDGSSSELLQAGQLIALSPEMALATA
jgi:response regulator RpfG family c-di-GMP phosphodiesterase